ILVALEHQHLLARREIPDDGLVENSVVIDVAAARDEAFSIRADNEVQHAGAMPLECKKVVGGYRIPGHYGVIVAPGEKALSISAEGDGIGRLLFGNELLHARLRSICQVPNHKLRSREADCSDGYQFLAVGAKGNATYPPRRPFEGQQFFAGGYFPH